MFRPKTTLPLPSSIVTSPFYLEILNFHNFVKREGLEMAGPKPKSPGRIEVWRHEVASFTPTETEFVQPPIRQLSFWKKILRRDSKSTDSANSKLNSQGDGKDSVKTEMWVTNGAEEGRDFGRESSMEIGSGESDLGGFSERGKRLERAAKLLDKTVKSKVDKDATMAGA